MPERSVILDRKGEDFAFIHGERRRSILRDEIPDAMVDALLAREDLRFFDHSGVDAKGLARATLRNIKDRSFTQGASTLSMQLARNSYDLRAKSLHRKFLEMALTTRIENHYSKDEILTHYLNRIYFGAGCHGVEEASQTYFDRSVSELNIGESAMLVGIIRGPHLFSPFRNYEGALEQRDEVLDRMVGCEFLTQEEADQAEQTPIRLVSKKDRSRGSSYVKESIRRHLDVLLEKHDIRDGGLRIFTTLDGPMQRRYDSLLSQPIEGLEKDSVSQLQGAVVRMHAQSGGVIVMCGGRNFQDSEFNRAYRAKRDLGPLFFPFLSALALERNQLSIPGKAVETGRQLGFMETIRLSKRLGFTGPFQENEDIYRGALAVSPMELAVATSVLVNQGLKPKPHFIKKITDTEGKVLYTHTADFHQAIRKDAAVDALATVKIKDGSRRLVSATGSSRDAWALDIEANIATVIWLGYDQPKKINNSKVVEKSTRSLMQQLQSQ